MQPLSIDGRFASDPLALGSDRLVEIEPPLEVIVFGLAQSELVGAHR
jgi:hypothetical protein